MSRLARYVVVGAVLSWIGLGPMMAAQASPTISITAVYQTPCSTSPCTSKDSPISSGDLVSDSIEPHISASDSVGLSTIELQARYGSSGSWTCLRHWDVSTTSIKPAYDWDTTKWPTQGCPSNTDSGLTRNGAYQLRAVATESVSGATSVSSSFTVKANNVPGVPDWDGSLSVSGDTSGDPLVTLRWTRVAQPDVAEYHWIRTNPDGSQTEFAVSASRPGGQGCDTSGDVYTCYDDFFPGPTYAGTYSYQLFALRTSPDGSAPTCVLPPEDNCIAGSLGATRTATLAAASGSPKPVPGKTPHKSPHPVSHQKGHVAAPQTYSDHPTYCDFYCGTYKEKLPYGQHPVIVEPSARTPSVAPSPSQNLASSRLPGDTTDKRRLWMSIAAGLLMVLGAAHITRLLRRA